MMTAFCSPAFLQNTFQTPVSSKKCIAVTLLCSKKCAYNTLFLTNAKKTIDFFIFSVYNRGIKIAEGLQ